MIQADFTICKIDGKTIDRSLVYRLLCAFRCQRLADRLTYEVTGPKVDDT